MSRTSSAQMSFFGEDGSITSQLLEQDTKSENNDSGSFASTEKYLKGYENKNLLVQSAKITARRNAINVTKEEVEAFLSERKNLIVKQLESELNRNEMCRLEYINWSLDRIDDAKDGYGLDILETMAERYEEFLEEIRKFRNDLNVVSRSR